MEKKKKTRKGESQQAQALALALFLSLCFLAAIVSCSAMSLPTHHGGLNL
jgi:hypothetical protein